MCQFRYQCRKCVVHYNTWNVVMIIHYMCSPLSIGLLLQCIVRIQNSRLGEICSTQTAMCTFKHWIYMLQTHAISVAVVRLPFSINSIYLPIYQDCLQQNMQLALSISMHLIMAWSHVNIELPGIFWYCNTWKSDMPCNAVIFKVSLLFYLLLQSCFIETW